MPEAQAPSDDIVPPSYAFITTTTLLYHWINIPCALAENGRFAQACTSRYGDSSPGRSTPAALADLAAYI